MTTETADRLIADYMSRLTSAAAGIPAGRREELLEQIAAHIASARAAGATEDEAGIRTLLDRLGEPEEIVAAACDDEPSAVPSAVLRRRPRPILEIAAFVMLTFGSIVPVAGWLTAMALVWSSHRWRLWEKLLATLVVPGGPALALFFAVLVPGQVCTTTSPASSVADIAEAPSTTCTGFAFAPAVGLPLLLFVLIGPFVVAGILLHRAIGRAAAEPLVETGSWWTGREIAAVLLLGPGSIFLPVLGPIIGLVVAWSSPRWSHRQKVIASIVTIVPTALALIGSGVVWVSSGVPAVLTLLGAGVLGPIIAAVYLGVSRADRSDTDVRHAVG